MSLEPSNYFVLRHNICAWDAILGAVPNPGDICKCEGYLEGMAAPGKVGTRPGEFGGVPGQYGNIDQGEPLSFHPELEQRAMYQTEGGRAVTTDELGAANVVDPAYGTGGSRVKSQSFS